MARQLRWWIGAALLACAAVALVYVPPRGGVNAPRRAPFITFSDNLSPARRRAQQLARQWRAADLQLRLVRFRQQLQPELARRGAAEGPGPTLLVTADGPMPKGARRWIAATLDSVWNELGLGMTKVAIGVVVEWAGPGNAQTPKLSGTAYLLPDAADPTTCLVLLRSDYRNATRRSLGSQGPRPVPIKGWLKYGLGPCAFYAAFGVPGRTVRQWLGRQSYDLALDPDWNGAGDEWLGRWFRDSSTKQWRWTLLYSGFPIRLSATALACLGGRPDACREAVLEGADDTVPDSVSRFVIAQHWWWRRTRLLNSDRYLADIAHDIGPERFLGFWNSADAVDTALAMALKMSIGEWTARWQRRFGPTLPLGPAAPASAVALSLLLAALAVSSVAMGAKRRQVR